MAKIRQGSSCPRCREGKVERVRRKDWMRRLPQSKHYRCKACGTQYLTLWGWAVRLPLKTPPKDD
jgi:transposase-like protein